MGSNGETFALDLKAFADKAKNNVGVVVRKVTTDLLTATVMRTPVGLRELWEVNKGRVAKGLPLTPPGYVGGRLRANWNVSLVTPDASTTDDIDKTGEVTIDRGKAAIGTADGAHDIFIMNSLPYAIPIEYGHSGVQAPAGMVRVSIAEFQAFVNQAAAEVNANEQ